MAKKSAKSAKKTGARSAKRAGSKSVKSAKGARGTKRAAAKGAKKAKASKSSKGARKRTPNAAFMAPVTPSPALTAVVGGKPLPRTEVTKRLWAYIKKNDLQDPKNRRMIKADATLKPIFGGKSTVNMFEMTKLVGKHLK